MARMAGEVSRRHLGVDAVRGFALISMFVAHAAPFDPDDLLRLSDFLTAALFATLVGVGAGMRARPGWAGYVAALIRGAVLIGVGLLLEDAGSQVVVILVFLGLLTWLMALLRPFPSWALAVLAVALFAAVPWLRDSWQDEYVEAFVSGDDLEQRLLELTFVGPYYRLSTLAIWALIGMIAARTFFRRRGNRLAALWQLALGMAALAAAAVMYVVLHGTEETAELEPYTGTQTEIVFNALLATGVLLVLAWVADRLPHLFGWMADMGRMSLTLYTLQIIWLAYLARVVLDGRTDDGWLTLASLIGGSVVLAVAWSRIPPSSPFARGPMEAGTDALVRLATRGR